MRILIVAATSIEVAPVVAGLREMSERGPRLTRYAHAAHDVDVLITGVGMVATAAWCSHVLALSRYDLALNFGVCGSFDRGAEARRRRARRDRPHRRAGRRGRRGVPDDPRAEPAGRARVHECRAAGQRGAADVFPRSAAITVNTVHGNERSIAAVTARFKPQVESMEGAAFMQCLPDPRRRLRPGARGVQRRRAAQPRRLEAGRRDRQPGNAPR